MIAPNVGIPAESQLGKICRQPKIVAIRAYLFFNIVIVLATGVLSVMAFTLMSGTYYAVGLSKDFAAVAIDSRSRNLLNPSSQPDDKYCKVYALADSLLFFSTGAATAANGGIKNL